MAPRPSGRRRRGAHRGPLCLPPVRVSPRVGYPPGMENLLREATHPYAPLAAPHGTSGVLFTLVGVLVVALLIAAFAWGRRIRSREPGPPHPESQPRLPGGEPVGDSMESREPEELPRTDHRRKPHELKGNGIDSRRRG